MNVEIIILKNGEKRYRGTCYINRIKKRSKTFKRKIDVIKWKENLESGYLCESVPSFQDACLERHEKHTVMNNKSSSVIKDEQMFRELFPIFGKQKLNEIQTQDIESHLVVLKHKGLSKASLKQRVTLIKAVYNWHIKRGVRVFNPCLAIQIKIPVIPPEHWKEPEAWQFLEYTAKKYQGSSVEWIHVLYTVALNTGCRRGELLALDWSRIDFLRRQILIDRNYEENQGRIVNGTKSGKHRYVGINDVLYETLKSFHKGERTGLLFTNKSKKPLDRRNFQQRYFKKDIKEAGVPDIKFHSLRDTYATIYMANGGSIYHLKELLGHSDIKMTMKYAHFHPDHATQFSNVVNIGRRDNVIECDFQNKKQG